MLTEPVEVQCPWCGEWFEVEVDTSAGDQAYVENCAVCCRPVRLVIALDEQAQVRSAAALREND